MTDSASDFPEYGIKYSDSAIQSRRTLPPDVLTVLDDVVTGLARNPRQFPQRLSAQGKKGEVLLYTHPGPFLIATFEIEEATKTLYFFDFRAPGPNRRALFVSYAHEDKDYFDNVAKFMGQEIERWDDTKIKAGDRWQDEIRVALQKAKGYVLLVSVDFLKSEFVSKCELPRILREVDEGHKRVFWVMVRPCAVPTEIKAFQALRSSDKALSELNEAERERAFVEMNERLTEAMNSTH